MADQLPQGFTLDEPQQNNLPQGFVLDEPKIQTGIQEVTQHQQSRIDELRQAREKRDIHFGLRQLEKGIVRPKESESREELLLGQGLETEGPALRMSRTRAGFTSNPIPSITQGLLEEFPDADEQQLNIRFEPLVKNKELESQIDDATLNAEAASEREIRERQGDGEEITQEIRNKIFSRNLQTSLTKMSGLELVFDDPLTGRTTVANPVGADIGDFSELLGPALPFGGELFGGATGAVGGSPAGPVGTVGGATLGGGLGGLGGEAARLGIGRLIGAEPEEADFLDPVLQSGKTGAFNSALGGGINALVARSIAKRVANGQFGMESARFANFLDPLTFSQNSKAIARFNELAKERGIKGVAKPTFGQLTGSKEALDFERGLAGVDGPINKVKIENAKLLDDVASSFNPKTGDLRRGEQDKLVGRIANEIEKRIAERERVIGGKIAESEAREIASQTKNILSSDFRSDNVLATESLRDAAQSAEDIIFKERFGAKFRGIEQRAEDVSGIPAEVRSTAQKIKGEQGEEVFQLTSADEQRFIDEAAQAGRVDEALPVIQDVSGKVIGDVPDPITSFKGLSKGLSNLKETKRKIDAGQLPDKNARTFARLISAGENDLQQMLTDSGRQDILEDLLVTRESFGQAKKLSKKAFGKLLSRDRSGNFKVDDTDVFEKIVLNPSSALGIKSMLVDTGQEGQIPLIREGIRDIYARKFLSEGAEPNKLKGAANEWFNQNERALNQFFSPKELAAFKNPVKVAAQEGAKRKKLIKAQEKMRQWFGADLASTKDTPQEFMDVVFNKGTPTRMKQLKNLLPEDQWSVFKDSYRGELLSKIRSGASEPGFNVNKLFSNIGESKSASSRELIGRNTAESVLGKKELKDLSDYGNALKILQQQGSKIATDSTLDKRLRNAVRFVVKPLSVMSRRANVLLNEGKSNVESRMERALTNPKDLKKMIDAVNQFQKKKVPPAAAISFVEVLGSDLFDQLGEIEQEIQQE